MTTPFEKRIGMQMLEVPIMNFVMGGFMTMFDNDPSARVVKVTADTDVIFLKVPGVGRRYELHITVHNKRTGRKELVRYTQGSMGVNEIMVDSEISNPQGIDYLWLATYIAKAVGGVLGKMTVDGQPVDEKTDANGCSSIVGAKSIYPLDICRQVSIGGRSR